MRRSVRIRRPSIYQSDEANVEYAIKWSKDHSVVTLDLLVDGSNRRIK